MTAFGFLQEDLITSKNENLEVTFRNISLEKTPFESFLRLSREYDDTYILESAVGPRKLAEFSFLGFNPRMKISLRRGSVEIRDSNGSTWSGQIGGDVFDDLRSLITSCSSADMRNRLVGGLVGFISYDAVRYWERLAILGEEEGSFPDFEFGLYDQGIIFDHFNDRTYYYSSGKDGRNDLMEVLGRNEEIGDVEYSEPKANVSRERYEEMVEIGKEYVRSGDIFQVVLARKYEMNVRGDLLALYRTLQRINPSPYMYYLKSGERQIIGSSPEMLVRVTGRELETFPIAGTRPRVDDERKNQELTRELLADPKENAEHVMLVDLARNDVGRVSEYGSVKVPEFMKVHHFSHVQHIVSKVEGKLSGGYDAFDAMKAVFPAGTVSGAPKVRAMEIIDELEPSLRGPYAGALGYFSKNGSADFAITIRTIVLDGERASIQAGAGIVADSMSEREWEETEQKVGALLSALELASER